MNIFKEAMAKALGARSSFDEGNPSSEDYEGFILKSFVDFREHCMLVPDFDFMRKIEEAVIQRCRELGCRVTRMDRKININVMGPQDDPVHWEFSTRKREDGKRLHISVFQKAGVGMVRFMVHLSES